MADPDREARVRPRGTNTYRVPPPEKIQFFVGPFGSSPVDEDFPTNAVLEPADFSPAMHAEEVGLLAHAEVRPPGAAILVVRLYPGNNPRDDQVVLSILDEDGQREDCLTAKVGEHSHDREDTGTVDFAFLLVFGDPIELPEGPPFDGLVLVDVSDGSWESCPSELIIRGGSWGERRLPVHQFNLEVERF